ncbi:hypothetical protein C8N40_108129 [Pontibacter mucosus]|uniref:Uncharacterized protein n=1 Tax=Pontibacter mucosus TaxID=1649266 RepID=A0A2T5YEX7_9BACT|nr:hypothetical protein [Pontibacter mucosus]PTX15237.1 hypothetical protein C8N40_108129 [Pontibacter mucosus]
MSIREAFFYLYYRLYRYYTSDLFWVANRGAHWRASFSIKVLQIWLLLSLIVYYKVYTKYDLIPNQLLAPALCIVVFLLTGLNYYILEHKRPWKKYFREFDKWPKHKNRIGAVLVFLLVLLILGNMIFSFYLMSNIDWAQYR